MTPTRRTLLQALAVVALGVLGWDAFQPRPDGPGSQPTATPTLPSQPLRNAGDTGPLRFTHLTADHILVRGQRLTVHGRVLGLDPARPAILHLEGPDGSMATTELRDDGSGEAAFSLLHPCPAPAPGSFSWKLRLDSFGDTTVLGVHVDEADPPRVLLLQDHPTVEVARLQRWLGEEGSPVTLRTRVSTDRYRITSTPVVPVLRERLDATALASFDIVVAHAAAIDHLSPEEHEILDRAVRHMGTGLLILDSSQPRDFGPDDPSQLTEQATSPADPAPQPNPERSSKSPLVSPWVPTHTPRASATEGRRETRIELSNGIRLESPVAVLAAELRIPPAALVLARDPQGRPLVAQASLGRGRWAYSIVLDTWRWRQHGHADDYARFWSALLSSIARTTTTSQAAWSLSEASQPFFVDHPVTLLWSGAPGVQPPPAEVHIRGMAGEPAIPLRLSPLLAEPALAQAAYWPSHPGWHTARALPAGPSLDFYVHPRQALPGVRAQFETDAARRAPEPDSVPDPMDPWSTPAQGSRRWIRLIAFLAFVFSAACLWTHSVGIRVRGRPGLAPANRSFRMDGK